MTRLARRLVALATVAGAGFLVSDAAAQTPASLAQAREWFKAGEAAEASGDCLTAIEKFKLALGVKETPQILLRIGRCQVLIGRVRAAADSAQRAIDLAKDNPSVRSVAQSEYDAIWARVPRVKVTLAAAPEPAPVEVTLDGARVEPNVEVPVETGEHVVFATSGSRAPFERRFSVAEGERRVLEARFGDAADGDSLRSPWPFVLLGVGGASLAGSVAMTVLGFSAQSRAYDDLAGPAGCTTVDGKPECPPTYEDPATRPNDPNVTAFFDEVDNANRSFAIAIGLGGLSALAFAGGVTWLVLDDGASADGASADGAATAGRAHVRLRTAGPWSTPDSAGLLVTGEFD